MKSVLMLTVILLTSTLTVAQRNLAPGAFIAETRLTSTPKSETNARGGSDAGGGDAIYCSDKRFYALDYVATEGGHPVSDNFKRLGSAKEILELMLKQLGNLASVGTGGLNFEKYIIINDDPTADNPFIWFGGDHELVNIQDENLIRLLQKCSKQLDKNTYQAVVMSKKNKIEYYSSRTILDELKKTSPVQLSFIYVHEWLRNYTDDPEVIRNANRFLHSEFVFKKPPSEIEAGLINLGVDIRRNISNIATNKNYKLISEKIVYARVDDPRCPVRLTKHPMGHVEVYFGYLPFPHPSNVQCFGQGGALVFRCNNTDSCYQVEASSQCPLTGTNECDKLDGSQLFLMPNSDFRLKHGSSWIYFFRPP